MSLKDTTPTETAKLAIEPVTVVVRRTVRAGRERDYEAWLERLLKDAASLPGFELWFSPPAGTVAPTPSRFRMALVMIIVVYGLVLSIGKLVGLVLEAAPLPLRLLVTITIEVFFMTYVLMPRLTRALARFIFPKEKNG